MAEALEHAARLIRFDTTNYGNGESAGERAAAEYVAEALSDYQPEILESAPGRANVLVRVPGTDPSLPAVLAHAHLDVVPAQAEDWSVPPFAAEVRDGFLWGRGAVDMKDMAAMLITVLRRWAREGRRPARDVVFAFVADEEDNGDYGARWLVEQHAERFAGCAIAISETGGYTYPVTTPDGRQVRLYPIAAAERGTMHLRLRARGQAGHGSRPSAENAVRALAGAVYRLGTHDWPIVLTPAVRGYIEKAAQALGFTPDLSTSDSVGSALESLGDAAVPILATVRNSTTPTVLDAGYKVNVIPSAATAQIDTRVLPGTEDDLFREIDALLGEDTTNGKVEREFIVNNPAVSSPIDSPWFTAMSEAIRAEDPDAIPVPFCMGGGTDAKTFATLGIDGYGFNPLLLPPGYDYRGMAHGVDERIPVDALDFGVSVLDRFLSH